MRTFFLMLLLTLAADAAACSCVVRDPKTVFKNADAVFIGEVISEHETGDVLVRVVERFKGPATGEEVDLRMYRMSSCAYPGETPPGSRHLIYGFEDNLLLGAGQCSRSAPEGRAACDLRYLRSRAGWWRSPLSSFRLLSWLGIRRDPCA